MNFFEREHGPILPLPEQAVAAGIFLRSSPLAREVPVVDYPSVLFVRLETSSSSPCAASVEVDSRFPGGDPRNPLYRFFFAETVFSNAPISGG